jgi:putative oxidoreductase
MAALLSRFHAQSYALLRIVAGLMFLMHGTQKIFAVPGDQPATMLASLMGVAGIIELACGALVMVGLFTSIAAFIASGEMAAAYFIVHAGQSFWPIINRGELATLYCFLFLFIAAHGSGIYSVDAFRKPATARA